MISGPVALAAPVGVEVRQVITAADMLQQATAEVDAGCDLFVASAAVADYRPESCEADKIKKSSEQMALALVRNPDTLATIAARPDAPFTVGFAAETTDVARYAIDKMQRKKLNMIVANDVSAPGLGFNSDNNAVTVFWPDGQASIGPDSKQRIAERLMALIGDRLRQAAR